jgi:hypothetical protein
MPKPVKYREFLRRLGKAGWEGPHQKVAIPLCGEMVSA